MELKSPRRLTAYVVPLILLALIWQACKKDAPKQALSYRTGCSVFVSFEMETTSSVELIHPSDKALLDTIDLMMLLPRRERTAVEACYKTDGTSEITMTNLAPENPIELPTNSPDPRLKPIYKSVKIVNGEATYYDALGQSIGFGITGGGDVATVQKFVEMAVNRNPVSTEQFIGALRMMRDSAGMLLQEHSNNLVSIRINNPDGSHCVRVVDKITQAAVGDFAFAADGTMLSRSLTKVEGTAQDPVLKRTFFESRIRSISDKTDLWSRQTVDFDNFSITTN